jgi:uncharacterized membrane protein
MDQATTVLLTVSGLLFGFLFAAFWWILNRELTFEPKDRHFKLATGLLMVSLGLLGVFGIIIPLRNVARANTALLWGYRGVFLAIVLVCGYMLVELGHYRIFQRPKYTTTSEWVFFSLTLVAVLWLVIKWLNAGT